MNGGTMKMESAVPEVPKPRSRRWCRRDVFLTVIGLLSVTCSLAVRAAYRGPYYAGWEALGQAHGLFLISTKGVWQAALELFRASHRPPLGIWCSLDSVIFSLIPGALTGVWPWQYWTQVVTLTLCLSTFFLIGKIAQLSRAHVWILFLAWGASPALLSYAIIGCSYAPAFLPHAVALWLTMAPAMRRRWYATLLLGFATNELSWQLYPLARTVFVVFLVFAVLDWKASWATRMCWLLVGVAQLALLFTYPEGNVRFYTSIPPLTVTEAASRLLHFIRVLLATQTMDIPILFVAGVLSCCGVRGNRRVLWLTLLVVQIGLVGWLALKGPDTLRPRRFLLVDWYCLLAIAAFFRERVAVDGVRRWLPRLLVTGLLVGNVWQVGHLIRFVQHPASEQLHALPQAHSQADFFVAPDEVRWFLELKSRVMKGEQLVLLYNLSAYPENTTDPAGVLERLYSSLGHQRFVNSVHVFRGSGDPCRYSCVPVAPLTTLDEFLDALPADDARALERVTGYLLQPIYGLWNYRFEVDSAEMLSSIRRRFLLQLESPKEAKYMRFKLVRRPQEEAAAPLTVQSLTGRAFWHDGQATQEVPRPWQGLPLDLMWVDEHATLRPPLVREPWSGRPLSLELSALLHVAQPGCYEVLLGSDDEASFHLDGRLLAGHGGLHPFGLMQRRVALEAGEHALKILYTDLATDFGGASRLLVDLVHVGPTDRTVCSNDRAN